MIRSACIATLAVALSSLAAAQDDTESGHYFAEFPVVLSASRLIQPAQEAPAAVTVIDREMIRNSGARQVAELFRLVPGFQVTYRNGHSPTVTYHGLADTYARRLQVMIDGVSFYNPAYGGVEWYELPIAIEDIERIEVVRGPNGASFGANAFVGMVNIITREPAVGDLSDVSVTSGSNGVNDWSARYAGGGEDWSYRLSAGQRSDAGFDGQPDSSRIQHFNLRGRYRVDGANEVSGALLYSGGVGTEFYSIERPRYFSQHDVQLRWTRATASEEFWVQFHHSMRHESENYLQSLDDLQKIGLPPYSVAVSLGDDQRRDEVEFQQSLVGGQHWRYAWGGQWREDGVRSATIFGRPDWLTNQLQRLFGSGEWRPTRQWLVQAGATYEHSSLSGGSVSPRLSATAFLSDVHSVRVGVSRARRMPTPFEQSAAEQFLVPPALHALFVHYAPVLPAPWNSVALLPVLEERYLSSGKLKDEKISSRELAYLGRWQDMSLTAEARWFVDQVDDLIYVYRIAYPKILTTPTYDFRNLDNATVRGIEGSLRWSPWSGADLMVAMARTKISSSDLDANYSASAPSHSRSILFSQRLPWDASVSLGYYKVGEMQWLGGGEPLPAYERIDLRLAKRLRFGQQTAELSWVTQNLLDSAYSDYQLVFRNKRISWLKLQYTF